MLIATGSRDGLTVAMLLLLLTGALVGFWLLDNTSPILVVGYWLLDDSPPRLIVGYGLVGRPPPGARVGYSIGAGVSELEIEGLEVVVYWSA